MGIRNQGPVPYLPRICQTDLSHSVPTTLPSAAMRDAAGISPKDLLPYLRTENSDCFDDASPFHGALARVILQGKAGYVDKRGRLVWQGEDDNAVPRP